MVTNHGPGVSLKLRASLEAAGSNLSTEVSIAHHPVTGFGHRTCPRCGGKTIRLSICGVCDAIEFGMTDAQVARALKVLTDPRGKRGVLKPRHAQTA